MRQARVYGQRNLLPADKAMCRVNCCPVVLTFLRKCSIKNKGRKSGLCFFGTDQNRKLALTETICGLPRRVIGEPI